MHELAPDYVPIPPNQHRCISCENFILFLLLFFSYFADDSIYLFIYLFYTSKLNHIISFVFFFFFLFLLSLLSLLHYNNGMFYKKIKIMRIIVYRNKYFSFSSEVSTSFLDTQENTNE